MDKIKPLLPSLKEKKRYLVYEIISEKKMKDPSREILIKVKGFLGVLDSAKAGLMNIYYDKQKQRGVIKVGRKHVDKLKTSLLFVKNLDDEESIVKTIGVSGILKKAKNKYIAG
jgi:ribonuclease P/MRP protein subunit POP5